MPAGAGLIAQVFIEPYDPEWERSFLRERELVAGAIGPWLAGAIEHVGSTAVPGMPAKPVVDMMAAVHSLEHSRPALESLARLGYCHAPYRAEVMHWLCKPGPEIRTHHLHLVPFQSALWNERIAFRELLRKNPGVAGQYAALKYRLAEIYRDDRERYTEGKGPFIESALQGSAINERPVTIVPYSGRWPALFEAEARMLRELCAPEPIQVEHIGSTAVPGMGAKPIVDVLLGAATLRSVEKRIAELGRCGYRYVPEFEVELPQRRYFEKAAGGDLIHLHAVQTGSAFWRDHIAFRDILRTDRRVFDEYHRLKCGLAESGLDRGAYTDAKAPFIQAVLASRTHEQ